MSQPPPLTDPSPGNKPKRWLNFLLLPLRVICYLALLVVGCGFLLLVALPAIGVCNPAGPTFSCQSEFWQGLADFAITMMLLTVFTGLPALLALGGVAFLIFDIAAWVKGRGQRT